jgi:tetratricopeptide (TPR) repeat protein
MDKDSKRASDDFDIISPAPVALARDQNGPPPQAPERAGRSRPYWLLPIAALTVVAAFVLTSDLLDPGIEQITRMPQSDETEMTAAASGEDGDGSAGDPTAGEPVAPYRDSRFQREHRAVQDQIARLMDLQDRLEVRAVARWGADAMAAAQVSADAGDTAFLDQQFDDARAHYQAAYEQVEALLAESERVYAQALARGADALRAGDAETARASFDLALAIESDSAAARRGLERAGTLDDVLANVRAAERLAAEGDLDEAQARVRVALDIDGESRQAREALAQVRDQILERDFTAALSRGYTALADQNLDAARTAFNRALALRSGADEAREGLRMVERATTDRRIEALRSEARRLEAAEQWTEAAARYAEALELDDTLTFARRGRERALERAELEQQIDATLADPDELRSETAMDNAQALLADARAVADPSPGLVRRIGELDQLLQAAVTPVPVTLRSDGATEVTILTVARLGSFEERTLELRPGVYTALGTRPGFRDVREQFRVAPRDANGNAVVIRCEERI